MTTELDEAKVRAQFEIYCADRGITGSKMLQFWAGWRACYSQEHAERQALEAKMAALESRETHFVTVEKWPGGEVTMSAEDRLKIGTRQRLYFLP